MIILVKFTPNEVLLLMTTVSTIVSIYNVESQVLTKRESYNILQLPIGASWKQVKRQYSKLMQKYNPDRMPKKDYEANEKTRELIAALRTLRVFLDPKDPCNPNPCQHGGTCRKDLSTGRAVCLCTPGYTHPNCSQECLFPTFGPNCLLNCGHCLQHNCHPVTGCKKCVMGFVSVEKGKCDRLDCLLGRNPCKNIGICEGYRPRCTCRPQYTGALCETFMEPDFEEKFLPCERGKEDMYRDCKNGGICVLSRHSIGQAVPECICKAEFFGKSCEKRCASNVPGICENGDCSFEWHYRKKNTAHSSCDCWEGYKGVKCEQRCSPGRYGRYCLFDCKHSHCLYPPCRHDIGFCPQAACQDGWFGLRCDEERSAYGEKVDIKTALSFEEQGFDILDGPKVRVPYEQLLDPESEESKQLIVQFMSWMDQALLATKRRMNMRDIIITEGPADEGGFNIREEEERKKRQVDLSSQLGIQFILELPTTLKNASTERRTIWTQMKAEADLFEFEGLTINKESIRLSKAKLTTFAEDLPALKAGSKTNKLVHWLRAGVITAFALTAVIVLLSVELYTKWKKKRRQNNGQVRMNPMPNLKQTVHSRLIRLR